MGQAQNYLNGLKAHYYTDSNSKKIYSNSKIKNNYKQ